MNPSTETMSTGEKVLKFFFLIGNTNQEISMRHNQQSIEQLIPHVISSYSHEGDTQEFLTLSKNIEKPLYLFNIFPKLVDYYDAFDFEDFQNTQFPHVYLYTEYIKHKPTNPFFNCFEYKESNQEQDDYHWYFSYLMIFEKVDTVNDLYLPKVMLIVTHEPYFYLCKIVLEKIYSDYKSSLILPLEQQIIHLFNSFEKDASNTKIRKYLLTNDITYTIQNNMFLGVCDLNLELFFQIIYYDPHLFLNIVENYLKGNTFLILSEYLEILYPFFSSLMTLLRPLDITDNVYFYRLLCPIDELKVIVGSYFPSIIVLYAKTITKEFIRDLVGLKGNVVFLKIAKDNEGKLRLSQKSTFEKRTKDENDEEFTVETVPFPKYSTLLKLYQFKQIQLILENFMGELHQMKKKSNNNINKPIYIQNDYADIRNLLFSLLSIFLTKIIDKAYFTYDENIGLLIDKIEQKKNNNKVEIEIEPSKIFEIIYKTGINLQKTNFKTMQYKILLDEIIKLLKLDTQRMYFDLSLNAKDLEIKTIDLRNSILERLDQLFYYKNKFARFFLKNRNLTSVFRHDIPSSLFEYKELKFYFKAFANAKKDTNSLLLSKVNNMLDVLCSEIDTFYIIYYLRSYSIEDKKELYKAIIGFTLSIIILNNMYSQNPNQEYIEKYFSILFTLFNSKTKKCFNKKFTFLLSMMYEIISANSSLKKKYHQKYIDILKKEDLLPSFYMLLKQKDKDSDIKVNNYIIHSEIDLKIKSLKEISTDHEHIEHYYEMFDSDKNEYKCTICDQIVNVDADGDIVPLFSPQKIMLRLLQSAISNRIIMVKDINNYYPEWHHDLINISFFANMYFRINLFRDE